MQYSTKFCESSCRRTRQCPRARLLCRRETRYVLLAAAKVGGIHANNTYPAEFIHDNLVIQSNVIYSAWQNKVSRLLFLGSSCIYSKQAPQPMLVADVVGFKGSLTFDTSKPDGNMRKVMDVSRINALGWHYKMPLKQGVNLSYQDMQART